MVRKQDVAKKQRIPSPMERRQLIEKELSEAQCLAIADVYEEDGRHSEGIVFLAKAGAEDRLAALSEDAIRNGDAFLLKAVAEASDQEPTSQNWIDLADAAEAAGRERYAQTARRYARGGED